MIGIDTDKIRLFTRCGQLFNEKKEERRTRLHPNTQGIPELVDRRNHKRWTRDATNAIMRDRRRGAAENNKVTTARVILCLLEVFQLVLLYNLMERNGGEEPI